MKLFVQVLKVAVWKNTRKLLFVHPIHQTRVQFEKRYRGSHAVDYEGYYYVNFGRKRITGTYFAGSDSFEMNCEEKE